jgi:hypothetical protein
MQVETPSMMETGAKMKQILASLQKCHLLQECNSNLARSLLVIATLATKKHFRLSSSDKN